jgi:hypothetical protein
MKVTRTASLSRRILSILGIRSLRGATPAKEVVLGYVAHDQGQQTDHGLYTASRILCDAR